MEIISSIKRKKTGILRTYNEGGKQMPQNIMQVKIESKREADRHRKSWIKNLREWCYQNTNTFNR